MTTEPELGGIAGARASAPLRALLIGVGTIALALGLVGIVVPVLPTTPFLLLAAACYARASTRLSAWLLGRPSLGPILIEWRRSRSMPPGVKTRALLAVVLTFGVSVILVEPFGVKVALAAVGVVLLAFLARIPTSAARIGP